MFRSIFARSLLFVGVLLHLAIMLTPAALLVGSQAYSANVFLFAAWVLGINAFWRAYGRHGTEAGYYKNRWSFWVADAVTFGVLAFTLKPLVEAGLWKYVLPLTVWAFANLMNIAGRVTRLLDAITKRLEALLFREMVKAQLKAMAEAMQKAINEAVNVKGGVSGKYHSGGILDGLGAGVFIGGEGAKAGLSDGPNKLPGNPGGAQ